MYENTKAALLRRGQHKIFINAFKGNGLHIGPGSDPLKKIHYPLCTNIETVNVNDSKIETDGIKNSLKDKQYDFVYSSHLPFYECEPLDVLNHWLNFVKTNGHLVFTVPDEDLYEQGNFPSIFNNSHKKTFSVYKKLSWSGKHYNILDILQKIDSISIKKIEIVDSNYDYSLIGKGIDQTFNFSDGVEACIEVIVKKF
jgi:SAM-dependent methyltransferase